MPDKEFKTIDEQIAILQGRGLQINYVEVAKSFLLQNNYYRVSGYSTTLRSKDVFAENATFQNIIDIYEFDHKLRHILLEYIERIEVTVKSIYAYEFTKVYGATGYLNAGNFKDTSRHARIMGKANEMMRSRLLHEPYLKHFVSDLRQDIPLWAFVDLLTISDISFLYSISPDEIKKSVADTIGLKVRGDELLTDFMHKMTIIRNLCAHGSRLYNRYFQQKPRLKKQEKALLRCLPDGTVDNAHLYGFVLIMRRLLTTKEFASMKTKMIVLSQEHSFVDLGYYGFRNDWKEVL